MAEHAELQNTSPQCKTRSAVQSYVKVKNSKQSVKCIMHDESGLMLKDPEESPSMYFTAAPS